MVLPDRIELSTSPLPMKCSGPNFYGNRSLCGNALFGFIWKMAEHSYGNGPQRFQWSGPDYESGGSGVRIYPSTTQGSAARYCRLTASEVGKPATSKLIGRCFEVRSIECSSF
jgi:hypothetical protein